MGREMANPKSLRDTEQNPQAYDSHGGQTTTPPVSLYEQSREERIKENLQRMQKLGILDLSDKFKSHGRPKRTPKNSPSHSQPASSSQLLPSRPLRRSSRLQNVTPISYAEEVYSKKDKFLRDEDVRLEVGAKPEVYTEEHMKLLGNTERSWELFVDGYGQNGKRIYDPVKGKTCHQCRQKTLGYRTQCCKCNMVQGQFCGDCLYMRYGEHVLEAIENPNWICPVCRGICNCSLCRQAKGWCPTGPLYKKISRLGYKSVAHYLIQTQSLQTNLEKNADTANQASVKRSLSFKDTEALSKEPSRVDKDHLGTYKLSKNQKDNNDLDIEENKLRNYTHATNHQTATKRSLLLSYDEAEPENNSTEADIKVLNQSGLSKPQLEDQRDFEVKDGQENLLIALESCSKPTKKRAAVVPSPDSIAGRLRQRRRKVDDGLGDMESTPLNEKLAYVEVPIRNNLSEKEVQKGKEMQTCEDKHGGRNHTSDVSPKLQGKPAVSVEPNLDNTSGTLKQRCGQSQDDKEELAGLTYKTSDVKQAATDFLSEGEVDTNMKHVNSEEAGQDGKEGLAGVIDKTSDVKQAAIDMLSEEEVETNMKHVSSEEAGLDSIARRLRPRHQPSSNTNMKHVNSEEAGQDGKEGLAGVTDKTSDVKQAAIDMLSEEEVETNMKHVSSEEAGLDSIARRLRPRRQTT